MPKKWLKKHLSVEAGQQLRPTIITTLLGLILFELLVFLPGKIDQDEPEPLITDLEKLSSRFPKPQLPSVKSRITEGEVPDYTLKKFDMISTEGPKESWGIIASQAMNYKRHELIHAVEVLTEIFDPTGTTLIESKEAYFFTKKREVEYFGSVVVTFPDGFKAKSEFLRYLPSEKRIETPQIYRVSGAGLLDRENDLSFSSRGMSSELDTGDVNLPKKVRFILKRRGTQQSNKTTIESDRALLRRKLKTAYFFMNEETELKDRFVLIRQPDLRMKSRSAQLMYGNLSKSLDYLVARKDVFIREFENTPQLRYGTAGEAHFDSNSETITLLKFPQVYQGGDTITGDKIFVHRDTNVIEVEQSNAFSGGEMEKTD